MQKIVNGEVVEMNAEEIAEFEASQLPCCRIVDGELVFDSAAATIELNSLVSDRRASLESSGVVYTHTTAKTYQTGPIPTRPNKTYHEEYRDAGIGGINIPVNALDNSVDIFTPAQFDALYKRVVLLGIALSASFQTLRAEAQVVTTIAEYEAVLSKINGDADWPSVPFPE